MSAVASVRGMPFTPSHVAAILPFRGRGGRGLPLAALAAGSMSPDLPYFQPVADWRFMSPPTHSPAGILTWDLLFGIALWLAWRTGARPLHDLLPGPVRLRWRPAGWPPDRRAWLTVVPAVLVGAATHVLWDEFTHAGRFGTTWLPAVAADYPTPWGPFPGYRLLQYASGTIGLAIVIWIGARQPSRDPEPRPRPALARLAGWLVPLSAVTAAAMRISTLEDPGDLRTLGFAATTAAVGTGAVTLALITAGHALTSGRHRPPQ